jgi:glycerol-3-phosphate acyltransferase PlsY
MGIGEGVLAVGLTAAAYAVGSIPFGVWIARCWTGIDIRRHGSGNIGATNVGRQAGRVPGVLTLIADTAKGALPTAGAAVLQPGEPAFICLVALAAFFGHLYPLYSRFRGGGKGVATAAGAMLAISPASAGTALLVFVMAACWSDRVSVGSIGAAGVLPLLVWEATHSGVYCAGSGILAVSIVLRHRGNIRRLIEGTEPRIGR